MAQNKDIAVELALDRRQVALWRQRFLQGGIDALRQDALRSGRTPTVTPEVESRILQVTLHTRPANTTQWSTRTLAEHMKGCLLLVAWKYGGRLGEILAMLRRRFQPERSGAARQGPIRRIRRFAGWPSALRCPAAEHRQHLVGAARP